MASRCRNCRAEIVWAKKPDGSGWARPYSKDIRRLEFMKQDKETLLVYDEGESVFRVVTNKVRPKLVLARLHYCTPTPLVDQEKRVSEAQLEELLNSTEDETDEDWSREDFDLAMARGEAADLEVRLPRGEESWANAAQVNAPTHSEDDDPLLSWARRRQYDDDGVKIPSDEHFDKKAAKAKWHTPRKQELLKVLCPRCGAKKGEVCTLADYQGKTVYAFGPHSQRTRVVPYDPEKFKAAPKTYQDLGGPELQIVSTSTGTKCHIVSWDSSNLTLCGNRVSAWSPPKIMGDYSLCRTCEGVYHGGQLSSWG